MRFIACALLVIATTHATKACTPGETKQDGANTCFCLGDGLGWVCAPGGSSPLVIPRNNLPREKREAEDYDDSCEPGTSFRSSCNSCRCGDDGKKSSAICTMKACVSDLSPLAISKIQSLREKREAEEYDDSCEPGTSFRSSCNSCRCGDDGTKSSAICTMKACADLLNTEESLKNPEELTTLVRKARDVEKVQEGRKTPGTCVPDSVFKYYCNLCSCLDDGLVENASCTRMKCDPEEWNEDGSRKDPETNKDGDQAPKDGLSHRFSELADNSDVNAIHFPSVKKREAEEKRCVPGESFMSFCNSCFCEADGIVAHSICTEVACDYSVWNEDGTRKQPEDNANDESNKDDDSSSHFQSVEKREAEEGRCNTGAVFKKFCNYCFCGTDRIVANSPCTKMACDLAVWNEDGTKKSPVNDVTLVRKERSAFSLSSGTCVPGAVFKYYCNTCQCLQDGVLNNASCTRMFCNRDAWNEDGTRKHPEDNASDESNNDEDSSSHFQSVKKREAEEGRCNTGEVFKKFCNYCFCGTDRIIANSPCTEMGCDLAVWNEDGTKKSPVNDVALVRNERSAFSLSSGTCVPGAVFKYYCNNCQCLQDGVLNHASCTRMFCNRNKWNEDGTLKHPEDYANNNDDLENLDYDSPHFLDPTV